MADTYTPGLQFQNWASLPSLREAIIGQQKSGGADPLLSMIGAGITKLAGGDSTVGNYLQYGQAQAPQPVPPPATMANTTTAPVQPPSLPPLSGKPDYSLTSNQPQAGEKIDYSKYLFSTR